MYDTELESIPARSKPYVSCVSQQGHPGLCEAKSEAKSSREELGQMLPIDQFSPCRSFTLHTCDVLLTLLPLLSGSRIISVLSLACLCSVQ